MQDVGNEIEEIRISLDEAREVIALKESVEVLISSPLFQKVIGKAYFEQESIRLVSLMAEDTLSDEVKVKFQKMMYGIAYFQQWLRIKVLEGTEMEQYLDDASDEINREVN